MWLISPFLDHGAETIGIGCHELIRLVEAELDWVVASVVRVVKGGLVRTQIHEELARPLVLQQQPLPESQRSRTISRVYNEKVSLWFADLCRCVSVAEKLSPVTHHKSTTLPW